MANTVKTVQIVVDAKDQASSVLKGIGGALQTAVGTFAGGAALKLATKGFDKPSRRHRGLFSGKPGRGQRHGPDPDGDQNDGQGGRRLR
jgi:hypothetical protein